MAIALSQDSLILKFLRLSRQQSLNKRSETIEIFLTVLLTVC